MNGNIARYFDSALLDKSDSNPRLRQLLLALDRKTIEDDFEEAIGDERSEEFYNAGVKFLGDVASWEKGAFQMEYGFSDKEIEKIEAILISEGLRFGMDVGFWRDYRKTAPEHYSAMVLMY